MNQSRFHFLIPDREDPAAHSIQTQLTHMCLLFVYVISPLSSSFIISHMSFVIDGVVSRKNISTLNLPRISMSSLASAPLLSNFDEPMRSRGSTRDSPLQLFDALHEDGMAVKKLGNQLKNCSFLFLICSPAFPATVALTYFTLNWFLMAMGLMVAQALVGSTGMRVGKKRKISKVATFAWWLKVFLICLVICVAGYQIQALNASLNRVVCRDVDLKEVCMTRNGWEHTQMLLICILPMLDLLLCVYLGYVLRVAARFERALINDLIGLNAAWQQ